MGSQSVTDFSAAKTKRIRARIYEYNPRSPDADRQAWDTGADLIGTFSTSSPYAKALAGASVRTAYELLLTLAEDLQRSRNAQDVFTKHGISPDVQRPYGALAAKVSQSLDENLAAGSKATDAAPAANDALRRTLLTVISEGLPRGRAAADASAEEIREAFRSAGKSRTAAVFLQNVISSLERGTLDGARGKASPAKVEQVVKKIDSGVARAVGEVFVKSAEAAGTDAKDILKAFKRGGHKWKEMQRDVVEKLEQGRPS
ncbi:MAG: hypothetical protein LAN70_12660 [Acidobacteriia bacterium]|nr:hypothetical protein [Terriglobia bacterium]